MNKQARRWPKVLVVLALLGAAVAAYSVGKDSEELLGPPCRATAIGGTFEFNHEQATHATTIAAVAKRRGLADRAVTIAIATALQESNLHNIDYGDLDSVGLFQQRPSQGWGTIAEIMSPSISASKFFDGLVEIDGWQTMEITDAAQAVQKSAFPEAYGKWETQARVMAQAFVGQVPAGFSCEFDDISPAGMSPSDMSPAMTSAMAAELGTLRAGREVDQSQGWLLAGWLIGHAQQWGVQTVTFSGQRWTADSGEWSPHDTTEAIVRTNTRTDN